MDIQTARELIALNNRFYAEHADSFSATRSMPWDGWGKLAVLLEEHGLLTQCASTNDTLRLGASEFGTSELNTSKFDISKPSAFESNKAKLDTTNQSALGTHRPYTLLDLACGNMRFERFIAERFEGKPWQMYAYDKCSELATSTAQDTSDSPDAFTTLNSSAPSAATDEMNNVTFTEIDILEDLIEHDSVPALQSIPSFDLVVSFGFMHHVPSSELRQSLLKALVDAAHQGGVIAISFWQFMNDERIAHKAIQAREIAQTEPPFESYAAQGLEKHDHFLGWQQDASPLRYCHHFSEAEIDSLVNSVTNIAHEIARYSADGPSGTLNQYLVLQKL